MDRASGDAGQFAKEPLDTVHPHIQGIVERQHDGTQMSGWSPAPFDLETVRAVAITENHGAKPVVIRPGQNIGQGSYGNDRGDGESGWQAAKDSNGGQFRSGPKQSEFGLRWLDLLGES